MTIELAVSPEVEEQLPSVAAARGMKTDEYVSKTIADAVLAEASLVARDRVRPTDEEFRTALDRLASMSSGHVPSGETFSREMIYADDWPR